MRIATDQRAKIAGTAALMTVAVIATIISVYSWPSRSVAVFRNDARTSQPQTATGKAARRVITDPRLRLELIKMGQYTGSGRNIFQSEPEHRTPPITPIPSPPPEFSSLVKLQDRASTRLRFFGYAITKGLPRQVFVRQEDADAVFVASEGDVIDRHYRISKIGSASVDIEDLLDNHTQTITLMSE